MSACLFELGGARSCTSPDRPIAPDRPPARSPPDRPFARRWLHGYGHRRWAYRRRGSQHRGRAPRTTEAHQQKHPSIRVPRRNHVSCVGDDERQCGALSGARGVALHAGLGALPRALSRWPRGHHPPPPTPFLRRLRAPTAPHLPARAVSNLVYLYILLICFCFAIAFVVYFVCAISVH